MVLDSLELCRRCQKILLVDLPAKKHIFPYEGFFCDTIKLISGENVLLIFEKMRGPSIHSVYKINLFIICQLKFSFLGIYHAQSFIFPVTAQSHIYCDILYRLSNLTPCLFTQVTAARLSDFFKILVSKTNDHSEERPLHIAESSFSLTR